MIKFSDVNSISPKRYSLNASLKILSAKAGFFKSYDGLKQKLRLMNTRSVRSCVCTGIGLSMLSIFISPDFLE